MIDKAERTDKTHIIDRTDKTNEIVWGANRADRTDRPDRTQDR